MSREKELMKRETQALAASEPLPVRAPAVDVYESADEILVLADMPGVTSDNLNISVEKGELLLEATRTLHSPQGQALETQYGNCLYQRRFAVPQGIDVAKVNAELKQGVLRLQLPKSAAVKPRRIEVRAG